MSRKNNQVNLNKKNIPAPPYAEGTFEQEKVKTLLNYVLGRQGWVIEIEGGKRGSKDVVGIYAWSKFLMVTPDKEHMVLGKTLEHAIVTVLQAQGFGLKYTIPSGDFVRQTDAGGQTRGVFKFVDAYGVEKIIYFYGNEKKDDKTKFKGFTLGSVYINEGNEQNVGGILEAKDRTNSAMRPRLLITQNPKAASHPFYTKFEEPLIYDQDRIMKIQNIQVRFKDKFEEIRRDMLQRMEKERNETVKDFLNYRNVPKAKLLSNKDYQKLMLKVRDLKEQWMKKIKDVSVKDVTDDFADDPEIHKASLQEIVNFIPYFENKNEVYNGLDFAYFHFTHYDNPSMSDADRERVARTFDQTSPTFKRDILGERATVDNAIWPTFNEDNIYSGEIDPNKVKYRVFGVDLGFDHPFAVVDAHILYDNTVCIHDELFIIPEQKKHKANITEYISEVKELIKRHNGGDYFRLRVDPSGKAFINQAVSDGLIAMKAKNRVRNYKPEDTQETDEIQDRKIAGIDLVREGFYLNKIMVHERCKNTIKQIQGYEFDPQSLDNGREVPLKINDDLPDALRYVVNSEVGFVSMWEDWSENKKYGEKRQPTEEKQNGEDVSLQDQRTVQERQQKVVQQLIDSFKGNGRGNGNRFGQLL